MFTQDEKCCSWARKVVLRRTRELNKVLKTPEKVCVFDIGHNTGDFVSTAFKVFGKDTIVHAFEPNIDVEFLYENNPSVVLNRIAISNETGYFPFFVPTKLNEQKSSSHLASLSNRPCFSTFKDAYVKTGRVFVSTVDAYCSEKNIDYIDYLKVDTEGYELEVFQGALKLLSSKLSLKEAIR